VGEAGVGLDGVGDASAEEHMPLISMYCMANPAI
jgi:hypothetical protein